MASENASLVIKIGAKSKEFNEALDKIQRQTKNLESQLKSVAQTSAVAFIGLTTTLALNVREFAQFENKMKSVKTLLDDKSFGPNGNLNAGFKSMQSQVLQLSKNTPVLLDSLTKSLFDIVSAGVDASQSVKVLGSSSKLAVAGVTDVAVATNGMTSALNSYSLSADKAETVAAKFFQAQKAGKTTVAELATGFGQVSSTAANLGVSLNELLAATAATTLGGKATSQVYSGLKQVLANIAKPTTQAATEARRLGVDFNAAALRTKGLQQFLEDLTNAQGFTKDSIVQLFGSVEALDVVFALTGSQAGKFKDILKTLSDEQASNAQFNVAYEEQLGSLSNQMDIFIKKVQTVSIQIGGVLSPAVSTLVSGGSRLLDFFSQHTVVATFAGVLLGVGAALTGTIALVTGGTLAFLKMRAAVLAAETAFPLFASGMTLLRSGMAKTITMIKATTFSIKGLATATGIGILLLALTELYLHWDQVWKSATITFQVFTEKIGSLSSSIKDILAGVFTLDFDRIKAGYENAKKALSESFSEIAERYRQSEDEKTKAVGQGADDRVNIEKAANDQIIRDKEETNQKIIDLNNQLQVLKMEADVENEEAVKERELQFQVDLQKIRTDAAQQQANLDNQIILERERKEAQDKLLRLRDEKKYGAAVAAVKDFNRKEEFGKTKDAFTQLSVLTQSHNAALFAIGKAAAIARAVISTEEGAIAAYTALAPIPIIGPALGAAAAAALIAYGVERVANISSQQIQGYAKGGLVAGGIRGVDSVPIMAQPNELIAPPQNYNEVVNSVADQRNLQRQANFENQPISVGESVSTLVLQLKDNLAEFVEAKLIERHRLGISKLRLA